MTYQLLKEIAPKNLTIKEMHTMPKGLKGLLIANTIYINNDYADHDKVFTLAHELAHYYLHYDKENTLDHPQYKEFEEQANRGAYMLLEMLSNHASYLSRKHEGVFTFNSKRKGVDYETE